MATPPVPDKPTAAARFERRFRGYDPGAVDAFVRHVTRQLEEASAENRRLTGKVEELASALAYHEERAQALQDAMVTAERIRREATEAAVEEADRIRHDASEDAERILDEARDEAARVRDEAEATRREAQTMQEAAEDEVETIRREAREMADSLAAEIEEEARVSAERLLEDANTRLEGLTAQIEKLEQRKSEFVHFLARELGTGADSSGETDALEIGPLDVRFRRDEETAERTSA